MHKTFKMAIPSRAILALTIPYIGAFTSFRWKRWMSAEVGGGRWRRLVEVGGGRWMLVEVGGARWRSAEVGGVQWIQN